MGYSPNPFWLERGVNIKFGSILSHGTIKIKSK